jgi:hypothetical protein
MIEIVNPFSSRFANLFNRHGRISDRKAWELNVFRTNTVFLMSLMFTVRGDHAGLRLQFGLFGFEMEFHFYDSRHWDYRNQKWEGV